MCTINLNSSGAKENFGITGAGLLRNRILKNSESEVKFEFFARSESESEVPVYFGIEIFS